MKPCAVLVSYVTIHAVALGQQPFLESSVRNAASYVTSVAPGSIIFVTGQNLGPAELVQAAGYPLPTTLAGTSVEATVNGVTVPGYLVYVSSRNVAAVLPSRTPAGQGTLTVSYNGVRSGARSFTVARSRFGAFTNNASGRGAAALQNVTDTGSVERNGFTRPARPRQAATLYGTGLGAIESDEGSSPIPAAVNQVSAELYVGGQQAQITYAGRSGCCPGLDQINFIVPEGVDGCHVPVLARIEGVLSNTTTIAVAAPGSASCSDSHGRTGDELSAAERLGELSEASVVLQEVDAVEQIGALTFPIRGESLSATFNRYPFDRLGLSTGFSTGGPPPTLGSCYTWEWGQIVGERIAPAPLDVIAGQPLDAGPVLTVTGPRGSRTVARGSDGGYRLNLLQGSGPGGAPFLQPGTWSITNGSGGANAGGFEARLTTPASMRWTNESTTTVIQRSEGYEAQWSGAPPDSIVSVTGRSGGDAGVAFTCFARGDAQRLRVPPYILEGLANLQYIGIAVSTSTRFTAPGIGSGRFTYISLREKPAVFR